MAFQKGGYGSYKMKPSWDVYGSKMMMLESNRPLPVTQWRSPRRSSKNYNMSGGAVIDLVQQLNGSYGLAKPKPKLVKLGGVSPLFPVLDLLLDRYIMPMTLPLEPMAGGEQLNQNWEQVCREPWHTNVNCYGNLNPSRITYGSAFCVYNNEWPPGSYPLSGGTMGFGPPQGWVYIPNNCLYPPWWNSWKQWQRKTAWDYWGQDLPIETRYWQNPKPAGDAVTNVFPEALPIGGLAPNPTTRPYYATPQRHPAAVVGREAGYSAPGASLPPPAIPPTIPNHVKNPPGRDTVERKRTMPKLLLRLLNWALEVTEYIDIVDAIADGLGYNDLITVTKCYNGNCFTYKVRAVPKTVPVMQFLYDRWLSATDAQLQQAILNVIMNEIQDQIIGRLQSPISVPGVGTFRQVGNTWILSPWQ